VPDVVLPGDLDAGDLVLLPGSQEEMTVTAVRLGHGGFHLTLRPSASAGSRGSAPEQVVTLAADTELKRTGRLPPAPLLPAQTTPEDAADSTSSAR
jgi:hypothetical protein